MTASKSAIGLPRPTRPLVAAVRPQPGESLAGMVASATRANVLASTKVILNEVGLSLAHPGTIGQELGSRAPALATVLGVPLREIEDRLHSYVGKDDGGPVVRFGAGTLRRSDLILERRRISPVSLATAGHHRAAWLVRHLPYCPESLEQLVAACPSCRETLRWSAAWGIGVCEGCRSPVGCTTDRLALDHIGGYRSFAHLLSTVEPQRDAARSLLAAPLAALPQQQLVDLILGLGMALAVVPATPGRSAIAALKPAALAAAASQGMAAISAWPEDLRRLTLERHDAVVGTTERSVLIRSLRALGDRRIFDAGVTGVIRDALPEAFERSSRALGGIRGPVALARDLLIGAGIDSARLAILDRSGALCSTPTGPARRMHRQYDAHDVAALVAARRGSTTATSLAAQWGLPVYAVEQLVLAGELVWEEHPALLLIEPELRIRNASIAAFGSKFDSQVSKVAQPGLITLHTAMRRIGGGPKPWGRVLAGIAGGTIPVSRHRGEQAGDVVIDPRTLMSSPDVIIGLRCGTGDACATGPIPLSTTMSQRDACELLNLDNLTIRPLVASGALSFTRQGRALRVDKAEVMAAAGRIMAASEIGPLLGVRNDAVRSRLRRDLRVPEVEGGWCRAAANGIGGPLATTRTDTERQSAGS